MVRVRQGKGRRDRIVPANHLARIGGQTAQDGGHRACGAVLPFVQRTARADAGEQIIVLGLIVAVPLVLLYALLSNVVKRVIDVLDEQSAGLIATRAEEAHVGA